MSLARTLLTSITSVAFVIGLAIAGTAVADADATPPPKPAPAFSASCPTGFSTADKSSPGAAGGGLVVLSPALIDRFRVGRHDPCYDRLVIDVAGKVGDWRVRYVNQITSDPKGDVLTVPGTAKLSIVVGNPVAHAAGFPRAGQAVIPTKSLATWGEFRSVIFAGSFENITSLGLGVKAKHGFRVFVLPPGPTHPGVGMLVVDVAHH